jgi:hypothetical protein
MYYIYEQSSTYIMGPAGRIARPNHRHSYKTMAAAKAALFGNEPSSNDPQFRYAIAEADYFHKHIEKQVKRKVLEGFGGKEYYEPVNTPNYMSPSSETYWSM